METFVPTKKPQKSQVYAKPLNNDTIRAVLGHSTWTLLHTMAARFPPDPTPEMQLEYAKFITLLSKMYPCGQCAKHFQVTQYSTAEIPFNMPL